jgi:hypothetical protein
MASSGTVRLALYGGDQKLYNGKRARAIVRVLDSTGLKDVFEGHTRRNEDPVFHLQNMDAERNLSYIFNVSAGDHRDAGGIFKVKAGRNIEVRAMLIPKETRADFSNISYAKLKQDSPIFHDALKAGRIPEGKFLGLEPERIAGSLNLEAKLRNTTLMGASALEFLKRIDGTGDILQDRIYAWFDPTLVEMLKASTLFSKTPFDNEGDHPGFPISYRQRADYASMQFSLAKEEVEGLLESDVDIDLYPLGIGHLTEVLRNKLKGRTDPFTVYTLLFSQNISPLYSVKTLPA